VLEYPAEWEYRVIGSDQEAIRAVIARVMAGREHVVLEGRKSREGRWVSVHVQLVVESAEVRDRLHQELVADPAVRLVM
jgi:putative lipoic acid-binding regulatory protein